MANKTPIIDVNDEKYTKEYFEDQKKQQTTNTQCQNSVLMALYELCPRLEIIPTSESYDQFRTFYEHCSLKDYTLPSRSQDFCTISTLHDQYQAFFSIIQTLKTHGLVECLTELTHTLQDERGNTEQHYMLIGGDSGPHHNDVMSNQFYNVSPSFIAGFLETEFSKRYHIWIDDVEGLLYEKTCITLTEKGYDVAIKLIEHRDANTRHNAQQAIMERSSQAARSSARTAKSALFAASFIAFGSIGNLAITIWPQLKDALQGAVSALMC